MFWHVCVGVGGWGAHWFFGVTTHQGFAFMTVSFVISSPHSSPCCAKKSLYIPASQARAFHFACFWQEVPTNRCNSIQANLHQSSDEVYNYTCTHTNTNPLCSVWIARYWLVSVIQFVAEVMLLCRIICIRNFIAVLFPKSFQNCFCIIPPWLLVQCIGAVLSLWGYIHQLRHTSCICTQMISNTKHFAHCFNAVCNTPVYAISTNTN